MPTKLKGMIINLGTKQTDISVQQFKTQTLINHVFLKRSNMTEDSPCSDGTSLDLGM